MLIIPISDVGRIKKRLIENKQFLKLPDLEGVFDMLTSNHINIKHLSGEVVEGTRLRSNLLWGVKY